MGILNEMGIVIGRGMVCMLALACAVRMGIETRPVAAQSVESSGLEVFLGRGLPAITRPGKRSHRTLDGYRMTTFG